MPQSTIDPTGLYGEHGYKYIRSMTQIILWLLIFPKFSFELNSRIVLVQTLYIFRPGVYLTGTFLLFASSTKVLGLMMAGSKSTLTTS